MKNLLVFLMVFLLACSLDAQTEKEKVTDGLSFLVEKYGGDIKARDVDNGKKQQGWMGKDDTLSPTAHTNSLMMTAQVDAHERRFVGACDIPNAFMQTIQPEEDRDGDRFAMRLKNEAVDVMLEIDHERNEPHVRCKGKTKVLCVIPNGAIHGMLQSALPFHKQWRKGAKANGFTTN